MINTHDLTIDPSDDHGAEALFHRLFDSVAVFGWKKVLTELAETASVRGDTAISATFSMLVGGLPDDDGGQEEPW